MGGAGVIVVYVEHASPLAHSVSPHMHAAALALEPSMLVHVGAGVGAAVGLAVIDDALVIDVSVVLVIDVSVVVV